VAIRIVVPDNSPTQQRVGNGSPIPISMVKFDRRIAAAAAGASALLALRLLLVLRYAFDSDESQHMHVAWAWAHGLVQYRDVFDNHMPLFQLLTAPLFMWPVEDARLLFLARYALVPLFIAAIFLVWRIARVLHDTRTAHWTAAMTALFAPFFLGTLEFRTDDLWVVLWLWAILVFIGDGAVERRSWQAAFLIGLAFAVSMKSMLFAVSIAGAIAGTFFLTKGTQPLQSRRTRARATVISILAVLLPPLIIAAAFALAGAWRSFEYGVFLHNVFPDETKWRVIWLIPGFFLTRAGVRSLLRSDLPHPLLRRRMFVFLACMIFGSVLSGIWPMLSLESYLPLYPLAFVIAVPVILESSAALGRRNALAKACLAIELLALIAVGRPWVDDTPEEVGLVTEVLAMTDPGDPVMDLKGETLFRERPYYLVIESITNRKLRMGRLGDDISEALMRTRTHVVATDRLPQRSRRFVRAQYLPWGRLRVAGFRLSRMDCGAAVPLDVRISGEYVLLGDRGPVRASLDGGVLQRRVFLRPGRHILACSEPISQPLLVWSGALRCPNAAQHRAQAIRDGESPRMRNRVMAQDDTRGGGNPFLTSGG
jgi:Dolichyl-phosphate-mannose-protein mannosyltransferase